jgi:hypothetical protein
MRGISKPAGELLASREGPYSMNLVIPKLPIWSIRNQETEDYALSVP